MSVDLFQPVVLVVKAPNQQIADQTVECAWDWTIRKLKDHLSAVYPSQPRQEQQKLIYYGRLLLDHLTLKDVLKQYEGQSIHTVHLVCSGSQTAVIKPETTPTTTSTDSAASSAAADGLRRRTTVAGQGATTEPTTTTTTTTTTNEQPSQPNQSQTPYQTYQQQMAQMAAYAQNPQMTAYGQNPQMMMYQQMYAQQMAHYMQYWQTMYQPSQQMNLPAAPSLSAPQSPVAPAPQAAPAPQPGQPARRENNNIVLNAGAGGAALFDDDEEQEQDWLDWFYTVCRFAVLVMIIYFYSTIPRAVVGLMFFFFLYMYQQGWFNPQPRRADVIAAPAPPAQPAAPAPAEPERPETERDDAETEQSAEASSGDNSDDSTPEPETPPPVSRLYLTWTFFKTFFTSLLPRPQAVV